MGEAEKRVSLTRLNVLVGMAIAVSIFFILPILWKKTPPLVGIVPATILSLCYGLFHRSDLARRITIGLSWAFIFLMFLAAAVVFSKERVTMGPVIFYVANLAFFGWTIFVLKSNEVIAAFKKDAT